MDLDKFKYQLEYILGNQGVVSGGEEREIKKSLHFFSRIGFTALSLALIFSRRPNDSPFVLLH